ncbi:MAG: hypothetical protein FAZ92_02663 [Accumulibacter sp.]|nr:MAG: hypothetical protein FAZ92_02663 [Accumulibacter sp.]
MWVPVRQPLTSAIPIILERERHDRSFHCQEASTLQAQAQGAFRHRRFAVRRARCIDQHHAPHPAVDRRRGDSPRPQPFRTGDRQRGVAGRCAGNRHHLLPGWPCRILQVHDRPAAGGRRREHQGLRRRRRRHRAERDRGTARLWRDARLFARGRPVDGSAGHDQRGRREIRQRPVVAGTAGHRRRPRCPEERQPAAAGTDHHGARERCLSGGVAQEAAARGRRAQGADAGHHRHRWRRQVVADRRAGAALPARPGRRHQAGDHLDRPVAQADGWGIAG